MPEESQVDGNTTEVQETVVEGAPGAPNPLDLSKEELVDLLTKANAEAAQRRRKTSELRSDVDAKLKEYEDWKRTQMSESERLKADLADRDKTLASLMKEKLRNDVVKETKLDPDLAELVVGETKEEMLKVAKKLVAKLGEHQTTSTTGASGMLAGVRGKPVEGSQKDDPNTLLRALINNGN